MITPGQLYRTPNALTPFYSRFRVGERLLLTGHSHQAWPDRGFEGQQDAWHDSALFLDRKWELAFERANRVRAGFSKLLEDIDGEIALGPATHDLIVRFLSGLPLRRRPRIVTTDGEFHSLRRQLDRVAEEGIEIVRVSSPPVSSIAERLGRTLNDRTAAVMVSSVFYQTAEMVPGLGELMDRCRKEGAALLVDAYHSLNVAPFSIKKEGLKDAFVVGGGYKYCQLGEGNCFLRFPADCGMRPVITGWFSEFESLERPSNGHVAYGRGPTRFAGSTYDPTSHYRASAVFSFFHDMGLTPELLREVSRHQIHLLAEGFDSLDLDPKTIARDRTAALENIGGFLVLHAKNAEGICRALYERGVLADTRGDALRLGPAPYLTDNQLREALDILGEIVRSHRLF